MTTENTALKGVADCMLRSRQIAINRHRHRTRARTGISSEIGLYLALNWQRPAAGGRHRSRARRFLTPQSITVHAFWPNYQSNILSLLRLWQFKSVLLHLKGNKADRRGKGGCGRRIPRTVLIRQTRAEFASKRRYSAVVLSKKMCGAASTHSGLDYATTSAAVT